MFRRKKSQEPERVKQISISAPRAMSALPQPPSSPSSSAPLYERFARTTAGPGPSTNTNTNANLRAPNSARPRVASTSNGGSGGGGVRTKQTPQKPLPALAIREDTTLVRSYSLLSPEMRYISIDGSLSLMTAIAVEPTRTFNRCRLPARLRNPDILQTQTGSKAHMFFLRPLQNR